MVTDWDSKMGGRGKGGNGERGEKGKIYREGTVRWESGREGIGEGERRGRFIERGQ